MDTNAAAQLPLECRPERLREVIAPAHRARAHLLALACGSICDRNSDPPDGPLSPERRSNERLGSRSLDRQRDEASAQ